MARGRFHGWQPAKTRIDAFYRGKSSALVLVFDLFSEAGYDEQRGVYGYTLRRESK
jgi:hypothetical protein